MKKISVFLVVLIAGLSLGLSGCQKTEEATDASSVEKKVDSNTPEHPDKAPPKDHPAH